MKDRKIGEEKFFRALAWPAGDASGIGSDPSAPAPPDALSVAPVLVRQANASHVLVIESGDASPVTIELAQFAARYGGQVSRFTPQHDAAVDPDSEEQARQARKFGFAGIGKEGCPGPPGVRTLTCALGRGAAPAAYHDAKSFEAGILHGQAVARLQQQLGNEGFVPDVVPGHPGSLDDAAPTEWQKGLHPASFRHKIAVLPEGIDSGIMRALPQLLARHPNCEIVIAGGDGVSYGGRPAGAANWRERMLGEVDIGSSRVHFLGKILYGAYRSLLQVSKAHVYLTYPFVLSWSMLEAMACGCALVASDTAPVREVIRDGENALPADAVDCARLRQRAAQSVRDRYAAGAGVAGYRRLLGLDHARHEAAA